MTTEPRTTITCDTCDDIHEMAVSIHMSDCALHNEPAYPKGPCTCGATVETHFNAIDELATEIRGDWSDPRHECRAIWKHTAAGIKALREMRGYELP